jgi:hypothetical protein
MIEAADPADPPVVQGKTTTSTDGIQIDGVDAVGYPARLRTVNANTGVRLTRTAGVVLEDLRLGTIASVSMPTSVRIPGTIRASAPSSRSSAERSVSPKHHRSPLHHRRSTVAQYSPPSI